MVITHNKRHKLDSDYFNDYINIQKKQPTYYFSTIRLKVRCSIFKQARSHKQVIKHYQNRYINLINKLLFKLGYFNISIFFFIVEISGVIYQINLNDIYQYKGEIPT